MKKLLFFCLCLLLLINVSGCKKKNQDVSDNSAVKIENELEYNNTMYDLLKKGENLICTFDHNENGEQLKGTVYIANDKSRSDFQMVKLGEGKMEGHTITDDKWVYSWNSMINQGTKMKIGDVNTNNTDEKGENDSIDYSDTNSKEIKYKCKNWKADDRMFEPPAGINFINMTELMDKTIDGYKEIMLDTGNEEMCKTCDLINIESAKQECKKNLGCK